MSDVLLMSALKLSNPVQIFIQMKTNNFPQLTLKLSWRFHKVLPDWNKPFSSWSKAEVAESEISADGRNNSALQVLTRNVGAIIRQAVWLSIRLDGGMVGQEWLLPIRRGAANSV